MKQIFLLLVFASSITLFGQNATSNKVKIEGLNHALKFANESAHGMLVVHRLLENYNQDINKYVDLESMKINFYTNKDLPKDIFEDPEKWFYDDSPYDLAAITSASDVSPNIKNSVAEMKRVITQINQLRFDLDLLIIDVDLTDTSNLNKVYAKLENGVKLYEDYFTLYQTLSTDVANAFKPLIPNANQLQFPQLYSAMARIYLTSRRVLLALRKQEDENIQSLIVDQEKAIQEFEAIDFGNLGSTRLSHPKAIRIKNNILNQTKLSLASAKKFFETAVVSDEYKQYGKFYYYYNSEIINKFNRYGNGLVYELNNLVNYLELPVLLFTELPHYYKVIYPKKLEKIDHLVSSDSKIVALPTILKERTISKSSRSIKVDSLVFEVSLYDHMIEDGDIISLNFNGDWIIEKMKLTSKINKLKLQLNVEGKNYFILHAENVGRRPPNTMAVEYYYQGKKQQIILKSDLNTSELIEIEYIAPVE